MAPITDPDEVSRRLAAESLAAGDPTGWFERLYVAAEQGDTVVPWDRGMPHRLLVEWVEARGLTGGGRRALVVGCGLGEDAEYIAGCGFRTVAFDVSATAIETARTRFPGSAVEYLVADVLDPPTQWREAFDLVVESFTVQALPRRDRGVRGRRSPAGADRGDPGRGAADGWPLARRVPGVSYPSPPVDSASRGTPGGSKPNT